MMMLVVVMMMATTVAILVAMMGGAGGYDGHMFRINFLIGFSIQVSLALFSGSRCPAC